VKSTLAGVGQAVTAALSLLCMASPLPAEDPLDGIESGIGKRPRNTGTDSKVAAEELDVDAVCDEMLRTGEVKTGDRVRRLPGEPPFWPLGISPAAQPAGPKGRMPANGLMWLPPGTNRVRAALLLTPERDSREFGESATVRKVAEKHRMAIVYLQGTGAEKDPGVVPTVMAAAAKYSETPDLKTVPWLGINGPECPGFALGLAAGFPSRTVGTIAFLSPVPIVQVPLLQNAAVGGIPHVNVYDETSRDFIPGGMFDRDSRTGKAAARSANDAVWGWRDRPLWLNSRQASAFLPHMLLLRDAAVGGVRSNVWDYLAMFMDKALAIRPPSEGGAADAPVALRKVDPAGGVLIEPYAIEDLRRVVRWPLRQSGNAYDVPNGRTREALTDGYAAIAPARDPIPDGVPVDPLVVGRAPSKWLVTEGVRFAMKKDPWLGLGEWLNLRPVPGTRLDIDGKPQTFSPLREDWTNKDGGIILSRGLQTTDFFSFLGYTVLEVKEDKPFRLKCYTSPKGRIQIAMNGEHVENGEALELKKGFYPTFFAIQLHGFWENLGFTFEDVGADEVRKAKVESAERAKARLSLRAALDAPPRPPESFIHKPAEVPEADRTRMFWLPDAELARAWLAIHTPPAGKGGKETAR
jgi:hypothetical protein